jgi:hypothetical protein
MVDASAGVEEITSGDLDASLTGCEIYAIDYDLPPGKIAFTLRSVLQNPGFALAHARVMDGILLENFGDPRAHTTSSWLARVVEVRQEVRALVVSITKEKEIPLHNHMMQWASTAAPEMAARYLADTLLHLRLDAMQAVAYLLQKSQDKEFNEALLAELAVVAFPHREGANPPLSLVTEIKWLLASHPDTSEGCLAKFGPTDLQWLSVLSHPNTSRATLAGVISSALHSQAQGAMDGGNISAALSHPWWTSDALRALVKETPIALTPYLVGHLLAHPTCPLELLEQNVAALDEPALVRLASLTSESNLLVDLAGHRSRAVRNAIRLNPRAPEHVRVLAALGSLGL